MLEINPIPLKGAALIKTNPFYDERGIFTRFFCQKELSSLLGNRSIVNINFSTTTSTGAIRGLHYQQAPMCEVKLIRCIKGAVFDVMVDIRKGSSTFLQWFGQELNEKSKDMLYLPEGFAHGFQVLEDNSELIYLHTEFYSSEHERGLSPFDPALSIQWPLKVHTLSQRDREFKPINVATYEGINL